MKRKILSIVVPLSFLAIIISFFAYQKIENLKGGIFRPESDQPHTYTYQQGSLIIEGVILPLRTNEIEGTFNLVFQRHKREELLQGKKGLEKYLQMISGGFCQMSPDSSHLLVFKNDLLYIISPLEKKEDELPRFRAVCINLPAGQ